MNDTHQTVESIKLAIPTPLSVNPYLEAGCRNLKALAALCDGQLNQMFEEWDLDPEGAAGQQLQQYVTQTLSAASDVLHAPVLSALDMYAKYGTVNRYDHLYVDDATMLAHLMHGHGRDSVAGEVQRSEIVY